MILEQEMDKINTQYATGISLKSSTQYKEKLKKNFKKPKKWNTWSFRGDGYGDGDVAEAED